MSMAIKEEKLMGQLEFRSIQDAIRRDTSDQWVRVEGIAEKAFLIKPYQRGYRWEKDNVIKLLEDIEGYMKQLTNQSKKNDMLDFIESSNGNYSFYDFYCLQALSVKKEVNGDYELIDGQQRLTTAFLIYALLDAFCNGDDRGTEPIYSIKYQRDGDQVYDLTTEVLKKIPYSIEYDNQNISCPKAYKKGNGQRDTGWFHAYKENLKTGILELAANDSGSLKIDLYYLSEAAAAIVDFLLRYEDSNNGRILEDYFRIIQRDVLFLWYEPEGANAEKVFGSLNTNKVYLTNAELIKALALKKGDDGIMFENAGHRWEAIEQGLSRNEFWSFISDTEKATRINLMLELYARQQDNLYSPNADNAYALFDWYEKKHSEKGQREFSKEVLEGIEGIYDRICEWYDDVEIFHCIGLLTNFRAKMTEHNTQEDLLKSIFDAYIRSASRDEFTQNLKCMIKDCILSRVNNRDKGKKWEDYLDPGSDYFQYDDPSQQANIKAVLWTLNAWEIIESAENNTVEGDKRKRKPVAVKRLPFSQINGDLQNKDVWTLEHIWPQHPDESEEQTAKDEYEKNIEGAKGALGKDDVKKITDSVHSIWNMALLTRRCNASVGNGTLRQKREEIIKKVLKDKEYIPTSTLQVFSLYYNVGETSSANDEQYWTLFDSKNYLKRITECLNSFLGEAYPAAQTNGGSAT